ncbi:MAG: MATE family efflux transporter [Hyphomicrobiales bacterium]|jgi:multidrug resistance protein, MATE family|nr:MATE family efflux transporter [Hyphomicrobiales bacterium]
MAIINSKNTYRYHYLDTLRMGFPIIIARTSILIMVTIDAIMTGWAGSEQLAYLGLGLAPVIALMVIFIGALNATVVLASQAIGAKEEKNVGGIWCVSMSHSIIFSLISIFLAFFVEDLFLLTGQEQQIAEEGARVSLVFAFGIPGMLFFVATNLILEAIGYQKAGMFIMIFVNILNILFNGIFILSWGSFYLDGGAYEAIVISSILRWLAFFISVVYLIYISSGNNNIYNIKQSISNTTNDFFMLSNALASKFRKIALPMSLLQGVETLAFSAVIFIAGWFGSEALAAQHATYTIMNLIYMSAIGVAGATSIRVGKAVGNQNIQDTQMAGIMGILVAFSITIPISLFTILYPELIARIFFEDTAMIELTRGIIFFVGFLFVFDTMMAVSLGALRGTGDVWVPFIILATCFWIFGIPFSYLFSVILGYGLVGLWVGIGFAIISSLLLLAPRFYIISSKPIKKI